MGALVKILKQFCLSAGVGEDLCAWVGILVRILVGASVKILMEI